MLMNAHIYKDGHAYLSWYVQLPKLMSDLAILSDIRTKFDRAWVLMILEQVAVFFEGISKQNGSLHLGKMFVLLVQGIRFQGWERVGLWLHQTLVFQVVVKRQNTSKLLSKYFTSTGPLTLPYQISGKYWELQCNLSHFKPFLPSSPMVQTISGREKSMSALRPPLV